MQLNLPVTQQENDWDDSTMIVSATDTRGYITHCNDTFVHVSGYSLEELVGANHNILRHPDVPIHLQPAMGEHPAVLETMARTALSGTTP